MPDENTSLIKRLWIEAKSLSTGGILSWILGIAGTTVLSLWPTARTWIWACLTEHTWALVALLQCATILSVVLMWRVSRSFLKSPEYKSDWDKLADRYFTFWPREGVSVHRLRQEFEATEGPHYLCPFCFDSKKRGTLHVTDSYNASRNTYHCIQCHKIYDFGDHRPKPTGEQNSAGN